MPSERPKTIHEYKAWLKKAHRVEVTTRTESHFDSVVLKVKRDFDESGFWKGLLANIREWHQEYQLETDYPLFTGMDPPATLTKTFSSFFLKTFRKNVLENTNWPEPPTLGWMLPPQWFSQANDLIRTCFTVKYLDGVKFLMMNVENHALALHLACRSHLVAQTDGYYAAHFYVDREYQIPLPTFDTESRSITVELQITTQLQEVIRKLLHRHFEKRRKDPHKPRDEEWQWDYTSDEFSTNYLGHILHYLEGMIMEIRSNKREAVK